MPQPCTKAGYGDAVCGACMRAEQLILGSSFGFVLIGHDLCVGTACVQVTAYQERQLKQICSAVAMPQGLNSAQGRYTL